MKKIDYGSLLFGTQLNDHCATEWTYSGKRINSTTMFNPHCHPHYEVLYVHENERMLTFERKKYILDKNKICIISPYAMHKVEPFNHLPQTRILLEFTSDYINKYAASLDINPLDKLNAAVNVLDISDDDAPKIKLMLDELIELTGRTDICSNQIFALTTLKLLTLCISHLRPAAKSENINLTDSILKYLELHYHEDITLDDIAVEFNANKYEISRKFTMLTGSSFIQHLSRIRIENAKRLLREHKLSVTNVGTHTGFRSSSDFARVFKAYTGMTPSQYRKFSGK